MRCLRLLTGALVLTATLVGLGNTQALADGCPPGTVPAAGQGQICIPVTDPGDKPEPKRNEPIRDSNGPAVCSSNGSTIPCTHAGGQWNSDRGCYLVPITQPPPGSNEWQGHNPSEGRVYACARPNQVGNPSLVFVPNGQEPPDPEALARRALDQLKLTVPKVHLSPTPPAKTYVGLETWLWMPQSQWSTLTKSVTAGSTTVTVTAEPRRVRWDMGAGSTVCYDAGRAWVVKQMSATATTSCQYTYKKVSDFQPDGKFQVSATIIFRARWNCSGTCLAPDGSLGDVDGLTGTSTIQVGERQSVNIKPRGT